MREHAQSIPNLTAASTALYEAIVGGNLQVYPDPAMRLAASRSVALETSRGWRITKEKASHKIDIIVALAMACLGAIEGQVRDVGPAVAPWEAFRSNPWSDLSGAREDVMPAARTMQPGGRVV